MIKPLTPDSLFRVRPPSQLIAPQQYLSQQAAALLQHHQESLSVNLPNDKNSNSESDIVSNSENTQSTSQLETNYCPICGQCFIRSSILAEHMHLCHQTELILSGMENSVDYPCQQCDETFRSTLELEDHIRNAHQMLRFSRCSSCGLFSMSLANGEYKCMHCGTPSTPLGQSFYPTHNTPVINTPATSISVNETNSKLSTLNLKLPKPNMTAIHTSNSSNQLSENVVSTMGTIQNSIFNSQIPMHLVKREIKTELEPYSALVAQQQEMEPQPNAGTPTNKRHKCPDCEKTFKTAGTLTVHRRVHSGEAEYKCIYCPKMFYFSQNLSQHLRSHTKERPYICTYCTKTFTQSNTLKQHTRIHTGEKPFHCLYCEKAFSVKDYLTKHIRTHTGEKPYTCSFCEKKFTQRSALTVHTSKLHPI